MKTRRKKQFRCMITALLALQVLLLAAGCGQSERSEPASRIKIGISVYDQYDTFISSMMDSFNRLVEEEKSGGKQITLEFYDAAGSQKQQDMQAREMIEDGCRAICINLVDRTAPTTIIDLARKNNVAVVFFNRELVEEDLLQFDKLYYVGADAFQSGILQGEIAAAACAGRDNPADRNGDGSIQYVVLEGEAGHQDAIVRTETSVDTLIKSGVQLDKVGYAIANWNRAQAQTKMSQLIDQYGDRIELVLANNDDMALGAIDAYRARSIDLQDRPLIFGIDGTAVGLEAIRSHEMAGTVYNDKDGQAKAMLELALRLAQQEPIDDLDMIDGKYIRLPYTGITAKNADEFE